MDCLVNPYLTFSINSRIKKKRGYLQPLFFCSYNLYFKKKFLILNENLFLLW